MAICIGSGIKISKRRVRVKEYMRKNGTRVRGYSYNRNASRRRKRVHQTTTLTFCPACGSLLTPARKNGKTVLLCPREGITYNSDKIQFSNRINHVDTDRTTIIEDSDVGYDSREYCKKCGKNMPTKVWQVQTRSSDEPTTTFYQCSKGHTWRDYG